MSIQKSASLILLFLIVFLGIFFMYKINLVQKPIVEVTNTIIDNNRSNLTESMPTTTDEIVDIVIEDVSENTEANINQISNDLNNIFKSDITNMQGVIPERWHKIKSADVMQPVVGGNIIFSAANQDGSCVMSYVLDVNKYIPKPWQQISHGERVFSQEWQIDSNWIAPQTAGVTTYQNSRTPLNGEVRLALLNSKHSAIILFNPKGGTVKSSCNNDMNVFLKSLHTYINTKILDSNSNGVIKMGEVGGSRDHSRRSILMFATSTTPEINSAWHGITGVDGLANYRDIFIYKNNLLQISGDFQNKTRIVRYDPLTQNQSNIITAQDDEHIIGMYIVGDTLYYLTTQFNSRFCQDKGPCTSALHQYPLSGAPEAYPVIVASGIKADRILGFSGIDGVPGGHVVYTSGGYGDAGCATGYFNKYISMNGNGKSHITDMGHYGGCVGENGGLKDVNGTYKAIKQMTSKTSERSTHINIKNEVLSPGHFKSKYANREFFIFPKKRWQ